MKLRILFSAALGAIAACVCGCRTTTVIPNGFAPAVSTVVTNALNPALLQPPTNAFTLGPGDQVNIEMVPRDHAPTHTFVTAGGKLYFDLASGVDVNGMTLKQAHAALVHALSPYYTHPQVSLSLEHVVSKEVWILGRVKAPGLYPVYRPTTLLDVIADAGGIFSARFHGVTTSMADLSHAFVIRNGHMLPVNFHALLARGDTSQNIYVHPGDFIYLPSILSREVYVLGDVIEPRPVPFVHNLSLSAALAKAWGPGQQPDLRHVAIVRGSLADPKVAVVDYAAILAGKAPDISLRPHDIVYIPSSPYRTLARYAHIAVSAFVHTVAADTGGSAASSSFKGVGVSVPLY